MDDARAQRILRQHVLTDHLLGVDAVPVGRVSRGATAATSAPDTPSLALSSGEATTAPLAPSTVDVSPPPSVAAPAPSPAPPLAPTDGDSLFGGPPAVSARFRPLDRASKIRTLTDMDTLEVRACTKCELCRGRTHTVFGEGDPDARLMFIGEGPGENEDVQGRPFVGRAGELLDRMVVAMGFQRQQVFIANVVKCRPPNNRAPTPLEAGTCWDYLRRQIATIQPRVLVALGAPATKTLLNTTAGITSIRGTWHQYVGLQVEGGPAIAVMPTFHPAYILRLYTPETRGKVWDDLKKVMAYLKEHP